MIDYRNLNSVTVDDIFSIPNTESLFKKLGSAIITFSFTFLLLLLNIGFSQSVPSDFNG